MSDDKLLRGILVALLDGKSREKQGKILKEAGFKQLEILRICGPSPATLRSRKHRAKGKNNKSKGLFSKFKK